MEEAAHPTVIREPVALRATHVKGMGTFVREPAIIRLTTLHATGLQTHPLPWTGHTVHLAA